MAFPTKPTITRITWVPDEDAVKQIEPSSGKKSLGWAAVEKPPHQWMNWLFCSASKWLQWAEDSIDWVKARATDEYDATVGSGKDYSTLAAALAAASSGWSILVCSDENLNSTVVVSLPNIRIRFKPGVTFSAGTATTGFQITGDRVTMDSVRLNGFAKGVEVSAASDFSRVKDCNFINCTTPVDMISTTSNEEGSIYES